MYVESCTTKGFSCHLITLLGFIYLPMILFGKTIAIKADIVKADQTQCDNIVGWDSLASLLAVTHRI